MLFVCKTPNPEIMNNIVRNTLRAHGAMTIASNAMRVYSPYLICNFVSQNVFWNRQDTHLSKVCCPRVEVHLLVNLVIPWQRVHDNHVALGLLEHLVVDDEGVLDLLISGLVGEALLLYTSAVQNVRRRNDLRCELRGNALQLTTRLEGLADRAGHAEGLRCHQVDLAVVVREQLAEGVHRTAVLEVTNEGNVEA